MKWPVSRAWQLLWEQLHQDGFLSPAEALTADLGTVPAACIGGVPQELAGVLPSSPAAPDPDPDRVPVPGLRAVSPGEEEQ
jgi:hypothetical protein